MKVKVGLLTLLLNSSILPLPNFVNAAFEPRAVGARPISLGQAFVAGQDDGSLVFWNPAGLAALPQSILEFTYEDLYSQGLVTFSHLAFARPDIGPGTLGISWTRLGVTSKVPFEYSENTYSVGYATRVLRTLNVGGTLNLYRLSSVVNGSGFGASLGAQFQPVPMLILGASYQNAGRTTIRYDSGAVDPLPDNLRLGLALLFNRAKIYADADQVTEKTVLHCGLELAVFEHTLELRGGVSQRTDRASDLTYAVGFGLRIRLVEIDYAFENHFDLGASHVVSAVWRF